MKTSENIKKIPNNNSIPIFKKYPPSKLLRQLTECETLAYYRNGTLSELSYPQHVSVAVQLRLNPEFKVSDFETRLPGNFDKLIKESFPNESIYMDSNNINDNEKHFFHPRIYLEENQYPNELNSVILEIFSSGHSIYTTNKLLKYISNKKSLEISDYHVLRAAAVGAGKAKAPRSAHEFLIDKYKIFEKLLLSSPELSIKNFLLKRGIAYSYASIGQKNTALNLVSDSFFGLDLIRKSAGEFSGYKRYQVEDSIFPTLETLSLCEALWGSANKSLEFSEYMVNLFPYDARARIRLAKSLYLCGDINSSIQNFIYAAKLEHYFFAECMLQAIKISNCSRTLRIIQDGLNEIALPGSDIKNLSMWGLDA